MFGFRNFSIMAVALAVPLFAGAADRVWSVSDAMLSFEVCPQTTSRVITVEGHLNESVASEDGAWAYDLLDKPNDDPAFSLIVYANHKLEVRDTARVRVTGPCTRKGSMDSAFPALWVDRFEIR